MKLSIDPCHCGSPSIYHSITYSDEGFRERHCGYTGHTWLEGHAAGRIVEIVNVVEKKFPKGSNITINALKKQSHADPRTAKKALKYLASRGHPLNGKIVARKVSSLQYYHDPAGEVFEFQCKNCENPILIDRDSTTICPHCESTTYFMCPRCKALLDVSDLPPVVRCGKCGEDYVTESPREVSLIPVAIGVGVGSLFLGLSYLLACQS